MIDTTVVGTEYDVSEWLHGKQISLSIVFENRIPSREAKCWLFGSTKKLVKFAQWQNAASPIDVTLDGIVMVCKLPQAENE